MEQKADLFSNKALKKMIIPLFLEQLLMALVGIADVFVVGFIGEAAVSGVSLVNSFNTIFLNLFTALASGGAVVISQYIGRREMDHAGKAATQLLTASVLLSVAISIVVFVGNVSLMRLLFGRVEEEVMDAWMHSASPTLFTSSLQCRIQAPQSLHFSSSSFIPNRENRLNSP